MWIDDLVLFDYDQELRCIEKKLGTSGILYKKALRQLKIRAQSSWYVYPDWHTLFKALKLFNRQGCEIKTEAHGNGNVVMINERRRWKAFKVKSNQVHPCAHCGLPFDCPGMLYFRDEPYASHNKNKLCVGCMGRKLGYHCGTDINYINKQLWECRKAQKNFAFRQF
jgi:ribosomal protein L37AE/L43A